MLQTLIISYDERIYLYMNEKTGHLRRLNYELSHSLTQVQRFRNHKDNLKCPFVCPIHKGVCAQKASVFSNT